MSSHITALVTHSEKQCGMLYKNDYDFSPKVKYWQEKGRALRALIRLKLGKKVAQQMPNEQPEGAE